jgi:hypothetical protein
LPEFSDLPTIFHVTHWKAGSQWVYAILNAVAAERIVTPEVEVSHFLKDPIIPGMIYPTVYVPREDFEAIPVPENHIKFFVMRDLRDTLISLYFSLRVSHPLGLETEGEIDNIKRARRILSDLDEERGLLRTMNVLSLTANIQRSWVNAGLMVVRYEDFLADEYGQFKKMLDYCQIKVRKKWLRQVVANNSFEIHSGREKGEEDISSHYRKGIAGDWKNYFTDRVEDEFKKRFGAVLITTGYEQDDNW